MDLRSIAGAQCLFQSGAVRRISRTYIPNLYGITTSPLHGGLPTDRLLIEWHLLSDRFQRILEGAPAISGEDIREICLPASSQRTDPDAQALVREQFLAHFSEGYVACGFREEANSHIYILERL